MKAYIIKTNDPRSVEYAKVASDSCDLVGLKWEYLNWYTKDHVNAWKSIGIKIPNVDSALIKRDNEKAQLVTAAHVMLWTKIADSNEPAIILEHDAVMLHNVDIEIPDNLIVVLGYKLVNYKQYDHVKAGPPKEIINAHNNAHEGAHAYSITPATAKILVDEVIERGILGQIDNAYFLKSRKTKVPLKIMSPTPAIGWLRESTIWSNSAERNYNFIQSFKWNLIP